MCPTVPGAGGVDNEQRDADRDHSDPETCRANASDEHDGSDKHERYRDPDQGQHCRSSPHMEMCMPLWFASGVMPAQGPLSLSLVSFGLDTPVQR
jgi:hypothetical protein